MSTGSRVFGVLKAGEDRRRTPQTVPRPVTHGSPAAVKLVAVPVSRSDVPFRKYIIVLHFPYSLNLQVSEGVFLEVSGPSGTRRPLRQGRQQGPSQTYFDPNGEGPSGPRFRGVLLLPPYGHRGPPVVRPPAPLDRGTRPTDLGVAPGTSGERTSRPREAGRTDRR